MTYGENIVFVIILISLLFMFFGFTIMYSGKIIRIFRKAFLRYLLVSLGVIFSFALVYAIITFLDVGIIYQNHDVNKWNKLNHYQQIKIMNDNLVFRGIDIKNYIQHPISGVLMDMFYFSCMTFFTVGYGDIYLTGSLRIFPIIEAFLGVAISGIYISVMLSDLQDESKKEKNLNILLSRGYDVLFIGNICKPENVSIVRKIFNNSRKKKYNIYLVDKACNVNYIRNIELEYEDLIMLEKYEAKWKFETLVDDYQEYRKFCLYLYFILENAERNDLEKIKIELYNIKEKIELPRFVELLHNLTNHFNKLRNESDESSEPYSKALDKICVAIKILRNFK